MAALPFPNPAHLLHLRLLVGNKKERTAILTGCLEAGFELMLENPNSAETHTIH